MDSSKKYEVTWEQICWTCNTADFSFRSTDELAPLQGLIGQDRALKAIEFGLEVDKPGYNLFVTGLTGTGKASAIKSHLQAIIDQRKAQGEQFPIYDWCYVHNFADSDRPQMLRLAPGQGKLLRDGLAELLNTLREEIPKVFASEEYASQRKGAEEEGRAKHQKMMQELEIMVRAENFGLQFSPAGVALFPLTQEGAPLTPEDFMQLGEEEKTAIEQRRGPLLDQVQETIEQLSTIEKDTQEKVRALDRDVGELTLSDMFRKLMEDYVELPAVLNYLAALKEYSLNNLRLFSGNEDPPSVAPVLTGAQLPSTTQRNPFLPFEINILVDNAGSRVVPIVIESNPTWGNLFGMIERRSFIGAYFSDHMMLKPGSIHQANGGYLVLNARDIVQSPGAWEGLKRAIRDKEARLEDPAVQFGLLAPQGLRPQPIPWNAKVIVTGDETLYRLLSTHDREDFWEMFKVKAEFDFQIDLTPENVASYCTFISGTCEAEGLLHVDQSGAARIVEYGARLVSDQTKLSSRFGQIKDLLIEEDYWARKQSSPVITANDVKKALDEKIYRLNLVEERVRHLIADGTLMVDVTGEVVGQVNGLAVYDLGDFSFGRPSRITAKTFAGGRGVINIER